MTDCQQQHTFSFHPRKETIADFKGGQISSDAGLLALISLSTFNYRWDGLSRLTT